MPLSPKALPSEHSGHAPSHHISVPAVMLQPRNCTWSCLFPKLNASLYRPLTLASFQPFSSLLMSTLKPITSPVFLLLLVYVSSLNYCHHPPTCPLKPFLTGWQAKMFRRHFVMWILSLVSSPHRSKRDSSSCKTKRSCGNFSCCAHLPPRCPKPFNSRIEGTTILAPCPSPLLPELNSYSGLAPGAPWQRPFSQV